MQTIPVTACDVRDAAAPTPEHSVLTALMTIGRLMRHRFAADGTDPGTFWLLKGLGAQGPMRVTELAALVNLDASTVSRHVQQLHRDGLIERTPDPSDRRAQRVTLSPRGREQLNDGFSRRRALITQSFADWDRADIETLDSLLARFVGTLENYPSELEKV